MINNYEVEMQRVWRVLNSKGIYTKEEAEKAFRETEDVDFGFFTTKIDFEEVNRLRKEIFGGN